jgi:hypothetical protein
MYFSVHKCMHFEDETQRLQSNTCICHSSWCTVYMLHQTALYMLSLCTGVRTPLLSTVHGDAVT